jgi:hypothetical protein
MEIKIIEGSENYKHYEALTSIEKKAGHAVRMAFRKYGNTLMKVAIADIKDKSAKTGQTYFVKVNQDGTKRKRGRRRHRASALGETHANLSGTLLRSMGWNLVGDTISFGYGVSGRGKEVPDYAEYVEFLGGQEDKPNRPTLQNTISKTEVDAINFLENSFEKVGLKF